MRKGNIDQLARELGISQRRVHRLVAEGVFDSASRRHPRHCEVQKALPGVSARARQKARIARDAAQAQADLDAGRPIRWTIELAAREFGVSGSLLRRRLREVGVIR
jgi:AraC-like DNA-binding protein